MQLGGKFFCPAHRKELGVAKNLLQPPIRDSNYKICSKPIAATMAPPCMLSCIDVDGLGRRLEAAYTCIGAAHALNMKYVHTRLFELQHGTMPQLVDNWNGLPSAFPRLAVGRAGAGLKISAVLRNLGDTSSDGQYRLALRTAHEGEHVILHHTEPKLCAGMRQGHNKRASAALLANRSWLHGVESGMVRCEADHKTVYTHADCSFFFWCSVVAERAAASWYAVLPQIQAAYTEASQLSAVRRGVRPWPGQESPKVRSTRPILVSMHIRTVKRRLKGCFTGEAYLAILDALRARHRRHVAMTPSSWSDQQRGLEIVVHCDGHDNGFLIPHEPVCPSHTCGIHRALRAMANMSDVRLAWQVGGARINRKATNDTSALEAMHDLLFSDVLIISESSYSIVPAMLANMTTIAPSCSSRALPHWHRLPCGHTVHGPKLQAAIGAAVARLEWPPKAL